MGTERKKKYERLEQTKRALRRDGYNRGVRAAIRAVEGYMQPHYEQYAADMVATAKSIRGSVKRLLKPPLENPNLSVKR